MAEQTNSKFKRRQYFINRKFQTGFMLKFFAVLFSGAVLSVMVTLLTTQETLTSSFEGSRLVIEKTSLAILPSVIFTNLITSLVVGIVAVVVILLVSHKIAGPMYRFEKDIEEISQGDLRKQIKTREGDQFSSVAINLNQMVSNLNGKISEVEADLNALAESAADLELPQSFRDDLDSCRRAIDIHFKLQ